MLLRSGGTTGPQGNPKLRPLDVRWVQGQDGRPYLLLHDPLSLAPTDLLVPREMAPLLALMDGSRDIPTIHSAFVLRTGINMSLAQVQGFIAHLERALLLDSPSFREAQRHALERFRQAPYRSPALAGIVYPPDPQTLARFCQQAWEAAREHGPLQPPAAPLAGVLSPHIDYQRGWPVYAKTWGLAAPSLQDVDVVVILGTDHQGGPGSITLTRQHYATPWGSLPTDRLLVDALAKAIGPEAAFAEELHHATEHSIELALVWLHYALGGKQVSLLPVLCGHFAHWMTDGLNPAQDIRLEHFIKTLREGLRGRRWLVVAAGDLAHVGPAFGDAMPYDLVGKARLKEADLGLLATVGQGNADGFFRTLQAEQDRRKVCGLSCIYLALRLMGSEVEGHLVDYAQCPADAQGTSLVSIAGLLWTRRPQHIVPS
ncbi:MAG: AmmeMemoRadiSam system protein B [Dehalococcoidia bacterium]